MQSNQKPYGLIYKTTNLINNKIYIGQTTNVQKWEKREYKGSGKLIKSSIKKYGWENFKSELICYAYNQEELNDLEIKYIEEFNSIFPNGYNISPGGDFNTKGLLVVKDNRGNTFSIKKDDPRWLSGEFISISKNRVMAKDNKGNKFKVLKDDPKLISKEYVGITKGLIMAKNSENTKFLISKDDPRWLSGELVGICKGYKMNQSGKQKLTGYAVYVEKVSKKIRRLKTDNVDSSVFEHFCKNKVAVKDRNGNKFHVFVSDSRYLSGELVAQSKGRKQPKSRIDFLKTKVTCFDKALQKFCQIERSEFLLYKNSRYVGTTHKEALSFKKSK